MIKNIYTEDFRRIIRAIYLDDVTSFNDSAVSHGHHIDQQIETILATLTEGAKGYKIEDDGVLVGYYIVDFTTQGMPFSPVFAVRKRFKTTSNLANTVQQIQQWVALEYPIRVLS